MKRNTFSEFNSFPFICLPSALDTNFLIIVLELTDIFYPKSSCSTAVIVHNIELGVAFN